MNLQPDSFLFLPLFYLILGLFLILAGFFILFKSYRKDTNIYFCLFACALGVYEIGTSVRILSSEQSLAFTGFLIHSIAALFIAPSFLGFVGSLLKKNGLLNKTLIVVTSVINLFAMYFLFDQRNLEVSLGISSSSDLLGVRQFFTFVPKPQYLILHRIYVLEIVLGSLYLIVLLVSTYFRIDDNRIKTQIKYLNAGAVPMLLFGGALTTLVSYLNFGTQNYSLFHFIIKRGMDVSIVFFIIMAGYSVIKFKLMDISTIIHRTGLWLTSSSLVFLFVYAVTRLFGIQFAGMTLAQTVLVLFTFMLLYTFYLLKVQPLIDQMFQRKKYNELAVIKDFIRGISRLTDLNDLTGQLFLIFRKIFYTRSMAFYLFEQDRNGFAVYKSYPPNATRSYPFFAAGHPFPALLSREMNALDKDLVRSEPRFAAVSGDALRALGELDAVIVLPFLSEKKLEGFLAIGEKENLKPFTKDDVQFLDELSIAFTTSLENSLFARTLENKVAERTGELNAANRLLTEKQQIISEELEIARKVQFSLVPGLDSLPEDTRLAFGTSYVPMENIGGDMFDVISLDDDRHAIVIADVSGHGVPAALIMMMMKSSFIHHSRSGSFTDVIVTEINCEMEKLIGHMNYYFTAFYGIIDSAMGVLNFTNAGHHPALLYRATDRTITPVTTKGILIGMFRDVSYGKAEIKLDHGDGLFLYTDGLIEARSESDAMFETERLQAVLKEFGHLKPQAFVDKLETELLSFCGSRPQDDDRAMIYVKWK